VRDERERVEEMGGYLGIEQEISIEDDIQDTKNAMLDDGQLVDMAELKIQEINKKNQIAKLNLVERETE
jgi:hypothetical protein